MQFGRLETKMRLDYIKQTIKIIIATVQDNWKYLLEDNMPKLKIGEKYVFIFFAADYNNLGDVAITVAQEKMIRENVSSNHKIVKVYLNDVVRYIKAIRKLNTKNVIVTMIGGGNNGTLYEFIERPRRLLLQKLRHYRIISFPQTVTFENTCKAKPYEIFFRYLCGRCDDLTLIAREHESFTYYKTLEGCQAMHTPDIVFSLYDEFPKNSCSGNKVGLIFRDDKEKVTAPDAEEILKDTLSKFEFEVVSMDTCNIRYENNSYELLRKYLANLNDVSFAVTDRLHGMILCYITNTPCIVFNNSNGKIKNTYYSWLQNYSNNVYFVDNISNESVMSCIEKIKNTTKVVNKPLDENFDSLVKLLRERS